MRKSVGLIPLLCFIYLMAPILDRCAPSTWKAGTELPATVIVATGTALYAHGGFWPPCTCMLSYAQSGAFPSPDLAIISDAHTANEKRIE